MEKLENTLENKARFFAQHWDQNIMYENGKPNSYFKVNHVNICGIKNSYLLLEDPKFITDKDAFEVVQTVMSWDDDGELEVIDVPEWLEEIMTGNCALSADYVSGNNALEVIDFLRSKGYALPYMGLSVKQQIEYGWVKLIA